MHYSESSNILHALLELPGVKKQDVQIKLATCYFNHVKFVSVRAESFPVFDLPGTVGSGTGSTAGGDQTQTQTQDTSSGAKPTQTSLSINPDLRERRFGLLQRVIQVPSTTEVRVSHFSNPPPVYSALQNKSLFPSPPFSLSSLSVGNVSLIVVLLSPLPPALSYPSVQTRTRIIWRDWCLANCDFGYNGSGMLFFLYQRFTLFSHLKKLSKNQKKMCHTIQYAPHSPQPMPLL